MTDLINDLLEISRVGTKTAEKQPVNMKQVIDTVLTNMPLKEKATINIASMDESYADPVMMRLLWENLISNALKFSSLKEKPELEITYSKTEHDQTFRVRDNGVGFDPAYSDKLFKVFSRLHAKHEFEGTGSGLVICKKIVEAHGGRIWGEAQAGKGAIFSFTLPLQNGQMS
jgi:light-regulated signal transduction histidine kinase (bacteriophytochrome)